MDVIWADFGFGDLRQGHTKSLEVTEFLPVNTLQKIDTHARVVSCSARQAAPNDMRLYLC